jgi:glycerophosphoryl diester phosphodiesterase
LPDRKISVIAHRGAAREAPENTLKSFQKAIDIGADCVEFDVHFAKDGEIVVIHDSKLKRTTGLAGNVKDFTSTELAQMDAGEGEHVPTLEEVIQLCKGRIKFQIELKVPNIAEILYKKLADHHILGDVLISSFLHRELDEMKNLDFRVKCATLDPTGVRWVTSWISSRGIILNAKKFHADGTHPYYKIVTRKLVKRAHASGMFVHPWTVDDPKMIRQQLAWGVDGIITNDPQTLIGILEDMHRH